MACLELRFRGPLREPAWRVVASLPTGHEHGEEHVDVYREVYEVRRNIFPLKLSDCSLKGENTLLGGKMTACM